LPHCAAGKRLLSVASGHSAGNLECESVVAGFFLGQTNPQAWFIPDEPKRFVVAWQRKRPGKPTILACRFSQTAGSC
jgi:hypothetical protein